MPNLPPDPALTRLVAAALDNVVFDGWSPATFDAAVAATGMRSDHARTLAPRGALDLACAYHRQGDAALREVLRTADFGGMGFTAKVTFAVRARIAAITPLEGDMLETERSKKSLPRVPFGALIDNGWLKPGDRLFSPQRRYQARIRVDGSLTTGAGPGSIHRLGAHVQQAPACNGWTYWHYETDKRDLAPIDLLRRRYREEMGLN